MSEQAISSGGIGFGGLLTIVFITLKLCNVIDWPWWQVLSPLWMPLCIVIIFFIVLLLVELTSEGAPKMAKFYVGQRVRVNSPGEDLHGMETIIIALDVMGWDHDDRTFVGAKVSTPAGIDMSDADEDFGGYCYEYYELEPIVDDGRRVISWEEMKDLWTPKELSHV